MHFYSLFAHVAHFLIRWCFPHKLYIILKQKIQIISKISFFGRIFKGIFEWFWPDCQPFAHSQNQGLSGPMPISRLEVLLNASHLSLPCTVAVAAVAARPPHVCTGWVGACPSPPRAPLSPCLPTRWCWAGPPVSWGEVGIAEGRETQMPF